MWEGCESFLATVEDYLPTLEKLITRSVAGMRKRHG